jgi:hypothetical protein
MKTENAGFPDARRARVPAAWRGVLDRLTTASRLHAIACPRTPTLERECALFQHGPATEALAKRFDHELWCHPQYSIEGQQLNLAAKAHARREPAKRLHRNFVYGGSLNEWSNWFRIEIKDSFERNPADRVRAARDAVQASAAPVFDQWRQSKTELLEIFGKERRARGRVLVRKYLSFLKRLDQYQKGLLQLDPFELMNEASDQMAMIRYGLEKQDGTAPDPMNVLQFALTDDANNTPTNRIRAALYAYEARQVAGGMRKPKPSMWLDVELISTMLPYVDAMLVEGHFAAGLRQVRRLLPNECAKTPVFSTRELPAFVEYLDGVIRAVPDDQRRAADALYHAGRLDLSE